MSVYSAGELTFSGPNCNAATLASTISWVTTQLSTYFAAHPDANQALIDATRQPAFVAAGQFEDYTDAHPDQADELRVIQAPLGRVQGSLRNAGVAYRRAHGARGPLSIEGRLGSAQAAGEHIRRGRQRAGALGDLSASLRARPICSDTTLAWR